MRFRAVLPLTICLLSITAPRAFGHAERVGSTPKPNARLEQPPAVVTVDFTEPPIADAVFQVFDGCERDVVDDLTVENLQIAASLGEGQPGRWRVEFHVVSGIDGHDTRDAFSFRVGGRADCSAEAAPEETTPDDDDAAGSSAGLIAFLAGGIVLAGVALFIRTKS